MTTTTPLGVLATSTRSRWRSSNELLGLLTLPLLVFGAVSGLAVWLLLPRAAGIAVALIAVHSYVGLVGLALVLAKAGVGVAAWRRRATTTKGLPSSPWLHAATAALLLVVLALYGSGVAMFANLTPGGNAVYKTVHLWSAVIGVPVVTLHLWRFLRRARTVIGRTVGNAPEDRVRLGRRHLLAAGALSLLGWAAVRAGSGAVAETATAGPNDFPVTLTAGGADQPDPATWQLDLGGDVLQPYLVTLADLRAEAVQQHRYSLDCVLGWSVTRTWGGVPLRDLVARARPDGEYISVVLLSTTGYRVALLRETVEDPRTLVAFQVDGVDLTAEHGFPARVMAPGVIGELCLKWVSSISVVRA